MLNMLNLKMQITYQKYVQEQVTPIENSTQEMQMYIYVETFLMHCVYLY